MISVYEGWASECVTVQNKLEEHGFDNMRKLAKEHFLNVCKTKDNKDSNITKELSTFVSNMEKAFLGGFEARTTGLTFFLGALEGIHTSESELPFSMMKLIGAFLLHHCGPIQSSTFAPDSSSMDVDSSYDGSVIEKVRDTALDAIATMLQIPITNKHDAAFSDCIEYRIALAKRAIRLRCASIEDCKDEEDYDDDYDDEFSRAAEITDEETNTLSGLSLLPRAKRSLCFRTLDAALSGMTQDELVFSDHSVCQEQADKINSFASFTAATLHGETDPRCLVQLLRLLKKVQEVLVPLVCDKVTFPFTQIFDACAVYYPVRFSPPPNDPHGITREKISSTLLEVFTCSSNINFIHKSDFKMNPDVSMLNLAAALFLERISPSSNSDDFGDDESHVVNTVMDRFDAIQDLKCLLNLSSKGSYSNKSDHNVLRIISNDVVRNLSSTILKCHEEAAASVVTSKSNADKIENKMLADSCRNFAMQFAYDLELFSAAPDISNVRNREILWNSFVKEPVLSLSNSIASSPQSIKGRMSIAYLASLAACGAERTVRYCVDTCLPLLFDIINEGAKSEPKNRDVERVSTAAYGVSALFSSCRLSMEQLKMDGVNVYPHPLEKYAKKVLQILCQLINHESSFDSSLELERSEIDIAAVKSLESVLQSTPSFLLDDDCVDVVKQFIRYLSNNLLSSHDTSANQGFLNACSRLVGSTIGKALQKDGDNNTAQTILERNKEVKDFAHQELLPKIVSSCLQVTSSENHALYALGYACETDQACTSSIIVSQIYNDLLRKMKSHVSDDSNYIISVFKVLAFLIRVGGSGVIGAFHESSACEDNDILHHLAVIPNYKLKDDEAMEGMSNLLLPETRDHYRSEAQKVIKLANQVVPCIIEAYYESVPKVKIRNVVLRIAKVLPPLSDADEAELTVYLPVLGAILSSVDVSVIVEITELVFPLIPGLCDFILNSDHNHDARSAAGSCVYFIISRIQSDMGKCYGLTILRQALIPSLLSKMEYCNRAHPDDCILDIEDSFSLIASIGCASACRGGISSATADEIARFFVLVACRGAVCSPELGISTPFDFIGDHSPDFYARISHSAASAIGSMFNLKDGNRFALQRLAHSVVPIILSSSEDQGQKNLLIGILLSAAHVVCSVPFSALSHDKLSELAELFVSGLFKCTKSICDHQHVYPLDETIILILTAILRLYETCSTIVRPHLGTLLPVLVLLCISCTKANESMISILSLQVLHNLSRSPDDITIQFCKAYKDTVIRHLAKALDHPSMQVRHTAMLVRNAWFVMSV